MSRTESLFIYMILPANFMRCGRGGAICPIYASLSIMMQRSPGRDWRWFRVSSRFWHLGSPFSASTLRTRCGNKGQMLLTGDCEGIWQGPVRLLGRVGGFPAGGASSRRLMDTRTDLTRAMTTMIAAARGMRLQRARVIRWLNWRG